MAAFTIAELSMHDRDYLASKAYSHCVLYREKINSDLAVNHSFPELMKVQAKINSVTKNHKPREPGKILPSRQSYLLP